MRIIDAAARVAVVTAAIGLSILVVSLDPGVTPTVAICAAILAAGGALANRMWILAVPFAAAILYLLGVAISSGGELNENGGEMTWAVVLAIFAIAALLAAVGLGLGVVLRMRADAIGAHRAQRRRTRRREELALR